MNNSAARKNNSNPHGKSEQEPGQEMAWKWFAYHAEQRLHSFRFFLTLIGLLGAAYGFCVRSPNESTYPVAIVVSLFAALCSIGFWMLDVRNTELVWIGRDALKKINSPIMSDIRNADENRTCLGRSVWILSWPLQWDFLHKLTRHELWLRAIPICSFLMSLIGAIYAYYNFQPATIKNSFPLKWQGPINVWIIVFIIIVIVLLAMAVFGFIHLEIVKQRERSGKKPVSKQRKPLHVA